MRKIYTLIGSRETPEIYLDELYKAAKVLYQKGFLVRSGGANGADSVAEEAHTEGVLNNANIYLPFDGFNRKYSTNRGYIDVSKHNLAKYASEIAEIVHPAWEYCNTASKMLHTRNVYQVLGNDLNTPSDFVICYAPIVNGETKGGTATAVNIALRIGVPVFNIYDPYQHMKLIDFILDI